MCSPSITLYGGCGLRRCAPAIGVILFLVLTYKVYQNLSMTQILIDFNDTNRLRLQWIDDETGLQSHPNQTLQETLLRRASLSGVIYLASVGYGYKEMALNLYYTSFDKFNINHYLFVGSDSEICGFLGSHGAACFEYIHISDSKNSSGYFTDNFRKKTHLKTKIVLEALTIGLGVIITDVDIVFLDNPELYLNCAECDMEISYDVIEANSGFYKARPTQGAINLHQRAWEMSLVDPRSNQKILNELMNEMSDGGQLKYQYLDDKKFTNGVKFFENYPGRMFKSDNPCVDCVIVHNNWILSSEAKIYRFKEYGLWDVDEDGYYSSLTQKYLLFEFPNEMESSRQELSALQAAFLIGDILGRVVILPKFHCDGCKYNAICKDHLKTTSCTLGTFYRISQLDKILGGHYRENAFLSHRLVPTEVKKSLSDKYVIVSDSSYAALPDKVMKLEPENLDRGATPEEISKWFGNETSSVLRFHSLNKMLDINNEYVKTHEICRKMKEAFVPSDYRQMDNIKLQ